MPWYVFALTDEVPEGGLGRGLSGALSARNIRGGFAIVERRADVPPPAFGSLRAHQDVVVRVSDAVPAILPVRFGTLLEEDALEEVLAERHQDLAAAFALVRHRVQFTWRQRSVSPRAPLPGMSAGPAPDATARAAGAAYLRRAASAAHAPPPASFRLLRDRLHAFVVREKFQPAAAAVPDTLYQLIDRPNVKPYGVMADALKLTRPQLSVSGPWPPFAFVPEVL